MNIRYKECRHPWRGNKSVIRTLDWGIRSLARQANSISYCGDWPTMAAFETHIRHTLVTVATVKTHIVISMDETNVFYLDTTLRAYHICKHVP